MFDPAAPPGSRIDLYDIATESSGLLDLDRDYTVATTVFVANGGDGFNMFSEARGVTQVIDEENA